MPDLSGRVEIILVWPDGQAAPASSSPDGYSQHVLSQGQDSWWIEIHRKAVPAFSEEDLVRWLERYRTLALPDGIFVATDDDSGAPVSTAGCIAKPEDDLFPQSVQVAWVATVPEARRRGIGTWLTSVCVGRLIREGHRRIYVSTGDDLTAAIRMYLELGFVPCLYAPDQSARWSRICATINWPFRPDTWPTREQILSS